MTYQDKVIWLKSYQNSIREEERINDEIEKRRARAEYKQQLISDMPKGNKRTNTIEDFAEYLFKQEEKIEKGKRIRKSIEKAIDNLSDVEFDMRKTLLRYIYINEMSIECAAEKLRISKTNGQRLHMLPMKTMFGYSR